jgi:hypothetical protein
VDSDNNGFLIADRRLSADAATPLLKGIKRDTSTLIRLLSGRARSSVLQRARTTSASSRQRPSGGSGGSARAAASGQRGDPSSPPLAAGSASTRQRDPQTGRFVASIPQAEAGATVERAVNQLTRQQAQQAASARRAEESQRNQGNEPSAASAQPRDARGRFGSGGGNGEGRDGGGSTKGDKDGMLSRLKDVIKGGMSSSGELEKIDPAIEAANELRNMVAGPLKGIGAVGKAVIGRGFSGGQKERDSAVPWYRRMLVQLRLMRKEDREFSQAEVRAIKGNGGGSGGDGDGIIMQAIKLIFSPVGIAIIGALTAGWMALSDRIGKAWDNVLQKFMGLWEPIANFLKEKLNIVGNMGNAANDAIKSATGVDIKGGIGGASDAIQTKGGSWLEKIMPGYRHKANFSGIKGGESLAENGRYTDAEAERIRQLKASGADTSANPRGGMSDRVRDKIIAQAKAAGENPETMLKFAAMESGGNPNAVSSTGAIGVMQLTGKTASGIGVRDRFNEDQNIAGGIALAKQNADILRKARLPATAENLYMMHQLGPDAAKELIAGAASGKTISQLSEATQGAVAKNYGAGSKTAKEYMDKNSAALEARASPIIGKSSQTAATPAASGPVPIATAAPGASVPSVTTTAPGLSRLPPPASIPAAAVSAPPVPSAAPRAEVPVKLNSDGPTVVTLANDQMANQDVRDRRLAQIATGGISG